MMFGGWGACPGFAGFGGLYNGYSIGGIIGIAVQIVFLIILVGGLFYLFRYLTGRTKILDNNNALSILQARYAKGEIDTEEYQRRKQEILR